MRSRGLTQGVTMIGAEGRNSSWSSCFVDISAQLVPTFLSKFWQKHNKIRVLWCFFLFTALMCFDSIFNMLRRVTDGSFCIFMQNISFSFSAFLEFGHPNYVSPKLVYRPQITSRSISGRYSGEKTTVLSGRWQLQNAGGTCLMWMSLHAQPL